jgi:hypothetical protein
MITQSIKTYALIGLAGRMLISTQAHAMLPVLARTALREVPTKIAPIAMLSKPLQKTCIRPFFAEACEFVLLTAYIGTSIGAIGFAVLGMAVQREHNKRMAREQEKKAIIARYQAQKTLQPQENKTR